MHGLRERSILAALVVAIVAAAIAAPAYAVEDGLYGVRIGTSYRALVERFGPPHGILFPSGSGMVFQTAVPAPSQAGLPDFSQQPQATETPVWVLPIRASILEANQTQWVYDFRSTYGFAIGILLNGEGADAVVSDVMVAGFPKYLKGKPDPIRTAKGVILQSTFEDVLKKYGYPPLIEIYPPSGAARGTAGGGRAAGGGGGRGGMRAGGGGGRGGMRAGGGGGRGGGRGGRGGGRGGRGGGRRGAASDPVTMIAGAGELGTYDVVLTGAPGRRGGGGRGGGMRGGGGRGGGGGGGRGGGGGGGRGGTRAAGGLPPLGAPTAAGAAEELTAVAVVDHQQISFSRDCVMIYEGIAFTLHDMKVYRIHVSE
ncbi:MAG: hypothetical protein MUQ65_17370 [Armatimonadetes bacterium]|nr:hypothetical protein [Armatimonadota bacterium]